MREIKFRAWDKENNKMFHYGSNEGFFAHAECHDWPVMQYTGLKDKNGKEIYEGDIIEYLSMTGISTRGVVEWGQTAAFYLHSPDQGNLLFDEFTGCFHEDEHWKVLGNIYENPELINKEGENAVKV